MELKDDDSSPVPKPVQPKPIQWAQEWGAGRKVLSFLKQKKGMSRKEEEHVRQVSTPLRLSH